MRKNRGGLAGIMEVLVAVSLRGSAHVLPAKLFHLSPFNTNLTASSF